MLQQLLGMTAGVPSSG